MFFYMKGRTLKCVKAYIIINCGRKYVNEWENDVLTPTFQLGRRGGGGGGGAALWTGLSCPVKSPLAFNISCADFAETISFIPYPLYPNTEYQVINNSFLVKTTSPSLKTVNTTIIYIL